MKMKHISGVLLLLGLFEISKLVGCLHLGLLSSIEVVEEWGCHDTEIRLTCGHLESKLAILEATFAPNCSHENCLRLDMKRLVRTFVPHQEENDLKMAEQEAGRKFLETLRRTHLPPGDYGDSDDVEIEMDSNLDDEFEEKATMYEHQYSSNWNSSVPRKVTTTMATATTTISDESNTNLHKAHAQVTPSSKKKRTSLRTALERLIIRYLRMLSFNEDDGRFARSRRRRIAEAVTATSTYEQYATPSSKGDKIAEGEYDESNDDDNISSAEDLARIQETRSYCIEQKRQVSSLDKNDLLRSYQNESEDEYNIRRVVNNRCSGKNHCSFIFSIDHPFAKIWDSGIVRLKYICMEEYRTNRFCGEHLTIDYEVDPKVQVMESLAAGGGPVAESRIQARETALHSLKILRPDKDLQSQLQGIPNGSPIADDDIRAPSWSPSSSSPKQSKKRKIKVEPAAAVAAAAANHEEKSSVYSQDFRMLKILPNNLDDFNDQIGDEIYFHKAESETNNLMETSTRQVDTISHPLEDNGSKHYQIPLLDQSDNNDNNKNNDIQNEKGNLSKYEDVTLTIRDGGQFVVMFPYALDNENKNITSNTIYPDNLKRKNETTLKLHTTEATSSTTKTNTVPTILVNSLTVTTTLSTSTKPSDFANHNGEEEEEPLSKTSQKTPTTMYSYDDVDGHPIEETKDKATESSKKFNRPNRYNSIQRNFYRAPLLHGFAMTPGYPKFYIGESDCKWNIIAPGGLQIRVTILDISLRYEEICKDFIRIDDLGINRTLFNSCSESIRPLEVVSSTNWIEIVVKTTTKFAYPKRGILLHYMAFGCVNLPLPQYGRLVERTETTALYQCLSSYVFPDTGISKRKLICNKRDIWDKLLPDCIEKEYFQARIANPSEIGIRLSKQKIGVNYNSEMQNLTNKENIKLATEPADMMRDVFIPLVIIIGLFVINGIVFMFIMRARRRNKPEHEIIHPCKKGLNTNNKTPPLSRLSQFA